VLLFTQLGKRSKQRADFGGKRKAVDVACKGGKTPMSGTHEVQPKIFGAVFG
jgi:hypothetical protein